MDTVLVKNNNPNYLKKYWYVAAIVGVLILFFMLSNSIGSASYVADKKDLRIAQVESGKFKVSVRSNGVLAAKVNYSVVSEVVGRVEAMFVKPGDAVEKGMVMVKLANPELKRDIDKLEWELRLVQAETSSELKQSESQVLDQEAVVLSAKLAFQGTELKLKAETRLREQERSSISELDYQRTKFDVEEQQARWDIEEKRRQKMLENIEQQKRVHQARKERLKNDIAGKQRQIDALSVRSTSNGVVQTIDLELGQQLDVGEEVGRVADNTQLIAELQIQELQVLNVQRGQQVSISTRQNVIEGKVTRIAPTVENGMVQVDVELIGDLPSEARPDMNIEGTVNIDSIDNAVFVNRPAYAQRDVTMGLYRVSTDGSSAMRIPVQLGQATANQVQVINGLRAGDKIIVSDTSGFEHHDEILLN